MSLKSLTVAALAFAVLVWSGEPYSLKRLRELPEFKSYAEFVRGLHGDLVGYVEVSPGIYVKENCPIEEGYASWYGGRFHGRLTSSRERFNLFKFTAASRTLPLHTYVLVRNLDNGKTVVVRINDRGPYVDGRIIDLSRAAARKIGMEEDGVKYVQVIPLKCLSEASLKRLGDQVIADLLNTY